MTATPKKYVPDGVISLSEARRRLGLKYTSQLNTLINAGDIQMFRLGARRYVVESSVATYHAKQQMQGESVQCP